MSLGLRGTLVCSMEVSDHKRSSEWYAQMLGCEVLFENEEFAMSYLKSPVENVWIEMSNVENPQTRGGATLVWGVTDIDSARSQLEEQGVRFDGETQQLGDMVKLATFFDPDGNRLMFYQNVAN